MPSNKIQKTITIVKIGDKDNKFWVKDAEGEFYSGFKEYNGTSNNEWEMLKFGNHGNSFQEGQQVLIEFTKTAGTDREGKGVIYKNIKALYPGDTAPMPSRTEKPAPGFSQSTTQLSANSSVDWDRLGYEKTVIALSAAMMSKGELYQGVFEAIEQDVFWKIYRAAKDSGRRHFDQGFVPFKPESELPAINQELETAVGQTAL